MKAHCPCCAKSVSPAVKKCAHCGAEFKPAEALISIEQAVTLGSALAHPTRRAILMAFTSPNMELSATDLTKKTKGRKIGSVQHHIRKLHSLGLLVQTRVVQGRGSAQAFYRVNEVLAR